MLTACTLVISEGLCLPSFQLSVLCVVLFLFFDSLAETPFHWPTHKYKKKKKENLLLRRCGFYYEFQTASQPTANSCATRVQDYLNCFCLASAGYGTWSEKGMKVLLVAKSQLHHEPYPPPLEGGLMQMITLVEMSYDVKLIFSFVQE